MKSNQRIAIWAEHYYQIYYALDDIHEHLSKGNEVILFTKRENLIENKLNIFKLKILYIDDYKSKFGERFDFLFKKYLVPFDFSEIYFSRYATSKPSYFFRAFNRLFAIKKKINTKYVKMISFFLSLGLIKKLPFDFDLIYVYTKVHFSYIIAGYSTKTISYMESWDHPQKGPYFINSIKHFTWNNALKEETKKYQDGLGEFLLTKPKKFNYIQEYTHSKASELINKNYKAELEWIEKNKNTYVLYPVCLSSSFYKFQYSELDFIKTIAQIIEASKLLLYVRPYPLAQTSDLIGLETLKNVKVGIPQSVNDGSEVFDTDYLQFKVKLIENCHSVLNVGTTFVFDAAYFDKPIIQLLLDKEFGEFSKVCEYPHIKSFLLNEHAYPLALSNKEELLTIIYNKNIHYNQSMKFFLKIDDLKKIKMS